jgi:hypothetical protein
MEPVSAAYVMFLVISHMTVSSTMLILNKAVLVYLPVATSVLLAQVGSSAIILWVLGKMKFLDVDGFDMSTVILNYICYFVLFAMLNANGIFCYRNQARAFFWNAVAFTVALFTNFKALESANVETIIVFRTLSIFATAYGDFRCRHELHRIIFLFLNPFAPRNPALLLSPSTRTYPASREPDSAAAAGCWMHVRRTWQPSGRCAWWCSGPSDTC